MSQKLSSQPRGISCLSDLKKIVVACQKSIYVFCGIDQKPVFELSIKFEGQCVDINFNGTIVAVGGLVSCFFYMFLKKVSYSFF